MADNRGMAATKCTETETHCEACGETSPEYVGAAVMRETEGYSACCGELTVCPQIETCRGHHLEA